MFESPLLHRGCLSADSQFVIIFRMYRLIYKSRCDGTVDWSRVNGIIGSSETHNRDDRITGVLLATPSHFLQIIEGKFEEINHLFLRIARDSRHEGLQLISFSCVESRLLGDWAMHVLPLLLKNGVKRTVVSVFRFRHGRLLC
jgi:hypothetical protein